MLTSVMPSHKLSTKSNILIDQGGRARLADFELESEISIHMERRVRYFGNPIQWMAPEVHEGTPLVMGKSDSYALGMVIYEVLTKQPPFKRLKPSRVMNMVKKGKRPEKPQGVEGRWFRDDLWEMLERCWARDAGSRPNIKIVHQCLGEVSSTWEPQTPQVDEGANEETDYYNDYSLFLTT